METTCRTDYSIIDRIMFVIVMGWALTVILFEEQSWGRYAFLGLSCLAYFVLLYRDNGIIKILADPCQIHILGFISFTLLSFVWAVNKSEPIQKTTTLFLIFLCLYPFYLYYSEARDTQRLLSALKWAGYLVAIYSVVVFGYDNLTMAAESQFTRLENAFANVNGIAVTIALSCLIEFWDLMNKRNRWQVIMYLPSLLVILATQSRKAFLFIILGFVCIIIQKNRGKHKPIESLLSVVVGILFVYFFVFLLSKADAFHGVFERFERMLFSYTGEGKADTSAIMRNKLVEVGIMSWKEEPFLGIGIGCSHHIAVERLDIDLYLHNNYVEILSGGGIIGFVSYYWIYAYLIYSLIVYRKNNEDLSALLIPWILLILIMDYGMVSYYSKRQWLYILTICVGVCELRENDYGKDDRKSNSIYIR